MKKLFAMTFALFVAGMTWAQIITESMVQVYSVFR